MDCPPVRADIPRAVASGLSYVQVDKQGIAILYHLHQCRHAHHELFHAEVCKCGINGMKYIITCWQIFCPYTHPWPMGCVWSTGQTVIFLKVVMLHIKLMGMKHRTPCKQIFCSSTHPRPWMRSKVIFFLRSCCISNYKERLVDHYIWM